MPPNRVLSEGGSTQMISFHQDDRPTPESQETPRRITTVRRLLRPTENSLPESPLDNEIFGGGEGEHHHVSRF